MINIIKENDLIIDDTFLWAFVHCEGKVCGWVILDNSKDISKFVKYRKYRVATKNEAYKIKSLHDDFDMISDFMSKFGFDTVKIS